AAPVDSLIDAALNTPSTPQPLGGPGASAPIADRGISLQNFLPPSPEQITGAVESLAPDFIRTAVPDTASVRQQIDAQRAAAEEAAFSEFREEVADDPVELGEVETGAPIYQPEQRPHISVVPAM